MNFPSVPMLIFGCVVWVALMGVVWFFGLSI